MKENQITDVNQFIGDENISKLVVSTKIKEESIEVVKSSKFEEILRNSKQIINYGENLDESLVEFLEVSPNLGDTIMIRKLKKAIEQVQTSKYFSYFGLSKRTGDLILKSESLEDETAISLANKLSSNDKIKENESNNFDKLNVNNTSKANITKSLTNWKFHRITTIRSTDIFETVNPKI